MKEIRITADKAVETLNKLCNYGGGQTKYILEKAKEEDSWIDLDIDNLPEFIKSDIEVQKLIDGNWVTRIKSLKSSIAYDIVEPTISSKYRYRIIKKETLKVTKNVWNCSSIRRLENGTCKLPDGEIRNVEIID